MLVSMVCFGELRSLGSQATASGCARCQPNVTRKMQTLKRDGWQLPCWQLAFRIGLGRKPAYNTCHLATL